MSNNISVYVRVSGVKRRLCWGEEKLEVLRRITFYHLYSNFNSFRKSYNCVSLFLPGEHHAAIHTNRGGSTLGGGGGGGSTSSIVPLVGAHPQLILPFLQTFTFFASLCSALFLLPMSFLTTTLFGPYLVQRIVDRQQRWRKLHKDRIIYCSHANTTVKVHRILNKRTFCQTLVRTHSRGRFSSKK